MQGRAHKIQCLFTESAAERARSLGIELHFEFPAGAALPQVGDFVGIARSGPRSRFVVREREFLWDGNAQASEPSVVMLMLDLPDSQWGETADEHRPSRTAEQRADRAAP